MSKVLYILGLTLLVWSFSGCQSNKDAVKSENSSSISSDNLSSTVKLVLSALEKSGGKLTPALQEKYSTLERDGQQYLRGTAKVTQPDVASKSISATGTLIESKTGEIWTLLIPVDRLKDLTEVSELSYLDLDTQSEITK
ncbi:hypothetical protein KFE98_10140 [bacterium SCSIO 12741]|nr:hypothetical protein KFE98_10140 [bacterium SCSIO 12741]